MKLFLFLALLFPWSPLLAGEPLSIQPALEALRTSKIPVLELEKKTFQESFGIIAAEWRKQHPDLSFPVAVTDYEDKGGGGTSLVTMHLRDVPFFEALRYLSDAARWGIKGEAGLLRMAGAREIVEDWHVQRHPLAPGVRGKLGLGARPDAKEVAAAYARYGVALEDWMSIGILGDDLVLMAFKEQHAQIAGINFLLAQGFTITRDRER